MNYVSTKGLISYLYLLFATTEHTLLNDCLEVPQITKTRTLETRKNSFGDGFLLSVSKKNTV